jgi:hypothetical protein
MKKILVKSGVLMIIIILSQITSSCEKCVTCTETQTSTVNITTAGYPQTTVIVFDACGTEIKKVDGKKVTTTTTYGNRTITTTSVTKCK